MAKRRAKGEGSIYYEKQNNRWNAQISLPNGQRKTKSGKNQKKVMDWLVSQRQKAIEGLYVTDDQIRLSDFLDGYMKDVASHKLRATTLQAHSNIINHHIEPSLGNIKLNALRPDQVQAFYTQKLNEGMSRGSQDPNGRQRLIEAINTVSCDFERVLIISHIDEMRDAFPTWISVEKGVAGSTIAIS
jgi:hypothetical protein